MFPPVSGSARVAERPERYLPAPSTKMFQDGLLGLKGPLLYPDLGPNMELEGLSARPG